MIYRVPKAYRWASFISSRNFQSANFLSVAAVLMTGLLCIRLHLKNQKLYLRINILKGCLALSKIKLKDRLRSYPLFKYGV